MLKTLADFISRLSVKTVAVFLFLLILGGIYWSLPQPALLSSQQNHVAQEGAMHLEFSRSMNNKSVETRLSVHPQNEGEWIWEGKKRVYFKPQKALELGKNYRIDLEKGAKNSYGKKLKNNFAFNFLVTGPPKIIFIDPNQAHHIPVPDPEDSPPEEESPVMNIDLHQPITVFFDQAMNFEAISPQDLLRIEPPVEGEFKFLSPRAFEFTPKIWPAKSKLEFTVPAGLTAQNGLKTQDSQTWSLHTPGQKIIGWFPEVQEAVALNQAFEITFQLPVNLENVRPGDNIQLFPSNDLDALTRQKNDGFFNTEVNSKPGDPFTLIFTPDPFYQSDTDYEMVFKTGLVELEEDFTLKFRTGSQKEEAVVQEPPLNPQAQEPDSSWSSFPAGFAPQLSLDPTLEAPLTVQWCALPPEVNPLIVLQAQLPPCPLTEAIVDSLSGPLLDLEPFFPNEPWKNAIYWMNVIDAQGRSEFHPLLLSDTVLMMKRAGDDLLVWALDRFTQDPIPRMEIRVHDAEGKELGRGVTDGGGIYKRNQALPASVSVMGVKELAGESRWSVTTDQWPLQISSARFTIKTSPEVYLITDKNQLQGGDTLNVKGVWRSPTQRGYVLPYWAEITLKLFNQNNEEVFSQVFPLEEKASFGGEFLLPDNLAPGLYELKGFEMGKELSTLSTWVKVEGGLPAPMLFWEEKPDFTPSKPRFSVQLKDAHGLPGVAEKGEWHLYEHNAFNPLHTQSLGQGEFLFDREGRASFGPLWQEESPLRSNVTYSLTVQEKDQEMPASLTHSFEYQSTIYPVALTLENAILEENTALQGYIRVAEEASIDSLDLILLEKGQKSPLWKRKVPLSQATQRFDYNDLILPQLKSGMYELQAMDGRKALSEPQFLYVMKDPEQAIYPELMLFLNHSSRPVNQKSKLLLNVPDASPDSPKTVLLSYEQAGLLNYDVVVAQNPLNALEFNVQPNMTPGVYISALTVGYEDHERLTQLKVALRKLYEQREKIREKDPEDLESLESNINQNIERLEKERKALRAILKTRINSTQTYLPVSETRKELGLELHLNPAQEEQAPHLKVRVLDEKGEPVPAALTLLLRPKAHFFLSPMDYFLSLPPFTVSTYSNLFLSSQKVASSSKTNSLFQNLIQPFTPLAHSIFEPLLFTDEVGELSYTFDWPQNPEAWELVAFANTQNNQWGSARVDLPLSEALTMTPILPPALSVGDSTYLHMEFKNHSDQAIEGEALLTAPSLTLEGSEETFLRLEPRATHILKWPIRVRGEKGDSSLSMSFNGKKQDFYFTIHSPETPLLAKREQVFAAVDFVHAQSGEKTEHFKQGEIYRADLTLMIAQDQFSDPQEEDPWSFILSLPAGLKMNGAPAWIDQAAQKDRSQASAQLKGIHHLDNPLWFFENISFTEYQMKLSSFALPAGVYRLEFELQAVWPGTFKKPSMLWKKEPINWEDSLSILVKGST